MALKIKKETQTGITLNEAYLKIGNISGNKTNIMIALFTYANKSACDNEKEYIEKSFYDFKPDVSEGSNNFIKQGYEYLKTLDEFKSAVDILE